MPLNGCRDFSFARNCFTPEHFGFMTKSLLRATFIVWLIVSLSACSIPNANKSRDDATAFSAPTGLTVSLTDSQRSNLKNVDLSWKNTATFPSGNFVEVDFNGKNNFTILAILESDITTFRHPDLVPDTSFTYRLHPFYGRPSNVATVTTGDAPPKGFVPKEMDGPLETNDIESAAEVAKSLKKIATEGEAAPTDLTATLIEPTRVVLKWKDRAADEDGYLVEGSAHENGPYRVMALLPPDTTSFRQSGLPAHTQCYLRVRAFFYGEFSNLAYAKTPEQPFPTQAKNSQ
jgi:hypothetical protein